MRWIAFGQHPTGVVAIGQIPTGVVAIGQGATGVIAIGQLARGVVSVGQLAVGLIAFGQLAIGGTWAGGMLSLAPRRGPALLGFGYQGRWPWRSMRRGRVSDVSIIKRGALGRAAAATLAAAGLCFVIAVAVLPVVRAIGRTPVEVRLPRQLR